MQYFSDLTWNSGLILPFLNRRQQQLADVLLSWHVKRNVGS